MKTRIAALACLAASMIAPPAVAGPFYSQPSDFPVSGRSSLSASQIDTTTNGLGAFATTYDNFTLGSSSTIGAITWQGGYFLPALSYLATDFQIKIYGDSSGKPGSVLDRFDVSSAAANAVFVGSEDSPSSGAELIYNYSTNVSPFSLTGGTYWLSIVAELPFQSTPPFTIGQWGWHTGTGGDGSSMQLFGGVMSTHAHDMAFWLSGAAVPEPSSIVLSAGGLIIAVLAARRRRASARAKPSPARA